ncbi:putative dsb repair complex subunit ku70 [Phaeomoniella chlamydospora]|uniref:ATP-dependent DNA helicase II subunit 1 n=1 Tax=Phaeomoniella chlamydospora TaxID=158046 RepID=A0A0G2GQJ3_PHACM|nr:putative dsb repair complex subunit ku70 [Phaeomoniella chlamydospora]
MADSDAKPWERPDEEEEEEELDETAYKKVNDAVLFAIEVSPSMLKKPPPSNAKKADLESPAMAAIKCAYQLMQQRIISNPKDMMGVLLYGTKVSKFHDEDPSSRGGLSYPHCYLLTDLDVPAAEDVLALKSMVEDEESTDEILQPSKEPVSMANVLFCANQIFTTKAPNFSSRRLFIVTDNDNPHATDRAMRSSAAVRAKDLYDLGVIIELFPISHEDHDFELKKFYDDIIYRTTPTDPEAPAYLPVDMPESKPHKTGSTDGITLLQSLLSDINSKSMPRRALFSSVPLEIAPGFRISIKGYLIHKHQQPARSCYVYLGGAKPQIAVGSTTQLADDTYKSVEKWEIRKAYKFGGEQVSFTPDEITKLRNFGDPIIRIIGFKPQSLLPIWANTRHSTFLYPSEEDFIGSTRVFSALYQKLQSSNLMALTWFIPRKNATPTLAAMLPTFPQSPTSSPQGLWLIPLPFADDIRNNPETTLLRCPDELTDTMRPVIQQLQLPGGTYDFSRYPNPSLQWHYRILQALALDEDLPAKPDDKTIPKYRQIDKRAGEYVIQWGEELERTYQALRKSKPTATSTLAKRSRPTDSSNGPSKKVKVDLEDQTELDIPSDDEMRALWKKDKLPTLTVQKLRDWLMSKKLALGGKKGELIERVERYFEGL